MIVNQNELFQDDGFELVAERPEAKRAHDAEPKARQLAFVMADGNQDVLFDERDMAA